MRNLQREWEEINYDLGQIEEAIQYYKRILNTARSRREADEADMALDDLERKYAVAERNLRDVEYEIEREQRMSSSYSGGYRSRDDNRSYDNFGSRSDSYSNYNRQNTSGVSKTQTYRPKTKPAEVGRDVDYGSSSQSWYTGNKKQEEQPTQTQKSTREEIRKMPLLTQTQKEYYTGSNKKCREFVIDSRYKDKGINSISNLENNVVKYSLAVDNSCSDFIKSELSKNLSIDIFRPDGARSFLRDEDNLLNEYIRDDLGVATRHMVKRIVSEKVSHDIYINSMWPGKIKSICVPFNFPISVSNEKGEVSSKLSYDFFVEQNDGKEDVEGYVEKVKNSIVAFNSFVTNGVEKVSDIAKNIEMYAPMFLQSQGLCYLPQNYVLLVQSILKDRFNDMLKYSLDLGRDVVNTFTYNAICSVEEAMKFENKKYFNDRIKKAYNKTYKSFVNEIVFMFIGNKYMSVVENDDLLTITTFMFYRKTTCLFNLNNGQLNMPSIVTGGGIQEGYVSKESSPVLWAHINKALNHFQTELDEDENVKIDAHSINIILTDKDGINSHAYAAYRVVDVDDERNELFYISSLSL